MYVCICNALNDRQVRRVLQEGADRVALVYARLGCRPQCGKCVFQVRDMLREHCAARHRGAGHCQAARHDSGRCPAVDDTAPEPARDAPLQPLRP